MRAEEEDEETENSEDWNDVDELVLRCGKRRGETVRLGRFVGGDDGGVFDSNSMAVELGNWRAQRLSVHRGELTERLLVEREKKGKESETHGSVQV